MGVLLVGWRWREAYLALGTVLVVVTFGHLVAESLFQFHTHVIPRTAFLLLFLLVLPAERDRSSVDEWREG